MNTPHGLFRFEFTISYGIDDSIAAIVEACNFMNMIIDACAKGSLLRYDVGDKKLLKWFHDHNTKNVIIETYKYYHLLLSHDHIYKKSHIISIPKEYHLDDRSQ